MPADLRRYRHALAPDREGGTGAGIPLCRQRGEILKADELPATMGYRVPAELPDRLPAFLQRYRQALPSAGQAGEERRMRGRGGRQHVAVAKVGRVRGWEAEADGRRYPWRYRVPADLPDRLPAFLRRYRHALAPDREGGRGGRQHVAVAKVGGVLKADECRQISGVITKHCHQPGRRDGCRHAAVPAKGRDSKGR